jgi:solute carrier family 29 (equilibrative nucleoside transporter) protein 4
MGREPKSEPQTPTDDQRGRQTLPPKDNYKLIYFALLLAGAGFLLPYNSFITAVDYLQSKYPGTTIVFDMSLTYICMAFVSVCVNNVLVETFRLNTRITFGYIISFVTLMFIAIFDVWLELFSKDASYKINLVSIAIVALGCTGKIFWYHEGCLPSPIFIALGGVIPIKELHREKKSTS